MLSILILTVLKLMIETAIVDYRKRINQVYAPPMKRGCTCWKFNDYLGHNNIRYFGYARHALVNGFRCIGVKEGDKILVPSFICRELLSSVNSIGAEPIFYDVNRELKLLTAPEDLPEGKAIIAVNYFGFPQDLKPFAQYCSRTGAVLVEDNAHGLFSLDKEGRSLGSRGDLGIFSFRKSISLPNGAALAVNNTKYVAELEGQIEFKKIRCPTFIFKEIFRKLLPLLRVRGLWHLTSVVRNIRKLKTGYKILPSNPDADKVLPPCAASSLNLMPLLNAVDVPEEILRRRELYIWLDSYLRGMSCKPVYEKLPDDVVPYCYPFYATKNQALKINRNLSYYGLECFPWPDLPDRSRQCSFEYYKNVWAVNFLW